MTTIPIAWVEMTVRWKCQAKGERQTTKKVLLLLHLAFEKGKRVSFKGSSRGRSNGCWSVHGYARMRHVVPRTSAESSTFTGGVDLTEAEQTSADSSNE